MHVVCFIIRIVCVFIRSKMFSESAASTVANSSSSSSVAAKKPRLDQITSGNLDADDPLDDDDVC